MKVDLDTSIPGNPGDSEICGGKCSRSPSTRSVFVVMSVSLLKCLKGVCFPRQVWVKPSSKAQAPNPKLQTLNPTPITITDDDEFHYRHSHLLLAGLNVAGQHQLTAWPGQGARAVGGKMRKCWNTCLTSRSRCHGSGAYAKMVLNIELQLYITLHNYQKDYQISI